MMKKKDIEKSIEASFQEVAFVDSKKQHFFKAYMVLIILKAFMVDIQTTVFTVANRSLSLDTVTVFSYTL